MTIRSRVQVFFLLLSLVPLALLAVIFYRQAHEIISKQILSRLSADAEAFLIEVKLVTQRYVDTASFIGSRPELLRSLASYNADRSEDHKTVLTGHLEAAREALPIISLAEIYDAAGEMVARTGSPPASSEESSRRVYKAEHSDTDVSSASLDFERLPTGDWRARLWRPLYHGGARAGSLFVDMHLLGLDELITHPVGLGTTEEGLLVRQKGGVREMFALPSHRSGPVPPTMIEWHEGFLPAVSALEGKAATFTDAVDYRGEPVLAVTRDIDASNWGLVLKIDRAEAFKPLRNLFWSVSGLGLILAGVAGVLAHFFARSLSRPLNELGRAVKRIQAGDQVPVMRFSGTGELAQLGRAFNDMGDRVREKQESLRERMQSLREQEEQTRAIVNSSLDAIVSFDRNGSIVDWNPSAEAVFGLTRSYVLGKNIGALLVPERYRGGEKDPFAPLDDSVRQGNADNIREKQRVLWTALCSSGVELPVEMLVCSAMAGGQRITICFIRDLTDVRRREEEQLLFSSILENSEDAIIGEDLNNIITVWNDAARRMFGFEAEEVIGHPITSIVPHGRKHEERDIMERLRKGERIHNFDTVRLRKDGGLVEVSISISAISRADGTTVGAAAVIRDITDQKLAQRRFELAVEAAPNAMVMVGPSGLIQLVNAHAEQLFGYSREELLDRHVSMLVPERLRSKHPLLNGHLAVPQQGAPAAPGIDLFARRKNGNEVPVEIGLNPVHTREGTVVLTSIVDISSRKAAEEFMKNSLREKDLLLKEIHHRVKNNMQVISSLLRLQGEYLDDARARQLFRASDERVRAMALIHERLYRSERFASIDLAEYIRELADHLLRSYAVSAPGVRLEADLEPVALGIDRAIPCGLLLNECISNALKHAFRSGEPGVLRIQLRRDEQEIYLSIADSGNGLPEDFDLNKPSSLGTEIIRTLVEQLSARLDISTDGGTTFVLRLQADTQNSDSLVERHGRDQQSKERKQNDGSGEHISV